MEEVKKLVEKDSKEKTKEKKKVKERIKIPKTIMIITICMNKDFLYLPVVHLKRI